MSEYPTCQLFISAFLDFLGSTTLIAEKNKQMYDATVEERTKLGNDMVDPPLALRASVEGLRDGLAKSYALPTPQNGLSEEAEAILRCVRQDELIYQSLSDSFVISIRMDDSCLLRSISSFYDLTRLCGLALLSMLACERPLIRGAISMGWGARLQGGDVYGASVLGAYQYEQKMIYPRIGIDPVVMNYFDTECADTGNDLIGKTTHFLWEESKKCLIDDGKPDCDDNAVTCIDPLSPAVVQNIDNSERKEMLTKCWQRTNGKIDDWKNNESIQKKWIYIKDRMLARKSDLESLCES